MTEPTSFNAPPELIEEVNEELKYGDSRSKWIRNALELKLVVDRAIEDEFESEEKKREFVENCLTECLEGHANRDE